MNYNRNLFQQINRLTNEVTGSYRSYTPPEPPVPVTDTVTITTQPTDVTCYIGDTATFSVVAVSDDETATLTYQWQLYDSNWLNIQGATSSSYTAPTLDEKEVNYRCVITSDKGGTATSETATLTVEAVPIDTVTIVSQPSDTTAYIGGEFSFITVADTDDETATLSYQWQIYADSTWTDISGATHATYVGTAPLTTGTADYRCVVTSTGGGTATTDSATLTVEYDTVTITAQPQSTSVIVDEVVTLSVTATSNAQGATLSYQWQVKNGSTYDDISGATSSTYTVNTSTVGTERYRVVVTSDKGGTATSNYADVTVASPSVRYYASAYQVQPVEITGSGIRRLYNIGTGEGEITAVVPSSIAYSYARWWVYNSEMPEESHEAMSQGEDIDGNQFVNYDSMSYMDRSNSLILKLFDSNNSVVYEGDVINVFPISLSACNVGTFVRSLNTNKTKVTIHVGTGEDYSERVDSITFALYDNNDSLIATYPTTIGDGADQGFETIISGSYVAPSSILLDAPVYIPNGTTILYTPSSYGWHDITVVNGHIRATRSATSTISGTWGVVIDDTATTASKWGNYYEVGTSYKVFAIKVDPASTYSGTGGYTPDISWSFEKNAASQSYTVQVTDLDTVHYRGNVRFTTISGLSNHQEVGFVAVSIQDNTYIKPFPSCDIIFNCVIGST